MRSIQDIWYYLICSPLPNMLFIECSENKPVFEKVLLRQNIGLDNFYLGHYALHDIMHVQGYNDVAGSCVCLTVFW